MPIRLSAPLCAGVALLAALAGCGDPKAANKDNFRQALAAHFRDHCIFVTPSVGLNAFPVSVSEASETDRYDALVSAGLLTVKEQAVEHPGPLGIGTVRDQSKTYDLTVQGKTLFQDGAANERGFCAGHYQVDDVQGFTPPVSTGGGMSSSVTFDVTPNLADWVKNPEVQARYGDQLAAVKPTTDHAVLVQTDKGWVVPAGQ